MMAVTAPSNNAMTHALLVFQTTSAAEVIDPAINPVSAAMSQCPNVIASRLPGCHFVILYAELRNMLAISQHSFPALFPVFKFPSLQCG